jgi:hypothetical protein
LDKYKENGEYRSLWKDDSIIFSRFVEEVAKKDWIRIEKHHFVPQTGEYFQKEEILKSKCIKVYDIKNIDYAFIESLYNKKIPDVFIHYRGNHSKQTN